MQHQKLESRSGYTDAVRNGDKARREASSLIKLFASDLDGTLFNALHEVDGTIRAALDRTLRAGRHVALATGRCVRSTADLGFGSLPLDVVCANGALILGPRGQLLRHAPLDPATLEELLSCFPTVCASCIALDGTYVRGSQEQLASGYLMPRGLVGVLIKRRMQRNAQSGEFHFDRTASDILRKDVCKVNVREKDPGLRRELDAFVADHANTITNASFDGDLFELTDASVNKGSAVAWLARHLDVGEDEVAVYGDGGNDLAMLSRFEHAYATRGASDEAKRAAGSVLGSCAFHAVPRHLLRTVRREGPLE